MSASLAERENFEPGLRRPLLVSGAVHLLLVCLVLFVRPPDFLRPHNRTATVLGYLGPSHYAPDLELLQTGGLQFYFYQPPRRGAASTVSLVEGLESQRATRQAAVPAVHVQAPRGRSQAGRPTKSGVHPAAPADPGGSSGRGGTVGQGGTGDIDGGLQVPDALPALQPDVAYSETFVILSLVKPTYPERELSQRISARIVVAVHVTRDGDIDEAQVQESRTDPPVSSHAFELTALEALRRWRIRLPQGEAFDQGCWLTVPIEFRPEDKNFGHLDQVPLPRTP